MNDNESHVTHIKILDRNYKIKCPSDQIQALQEAANYVDDHMRKMRQNTPINSTEHIAVVTALNICHELMQLRKQKTNYMDLMNQRIQDLQQRIEGHLGSFVTTNSSHE